MGPRVYSELSIIIFKESIPKVHAEASLGGDENRWYHVEKVELVTIMDMPHHRLEALPHSVYIPGQN